VAFKGPAQIPLKKAINYAIDRPHLVRAFGPLNGRRTDQLLPAAMGRDERIYPLAGADPATARKWLSRAKLKPSSLVFYTTNVRVGAAIADTLRFNLKQIGIDLDVKQYSFTDLDQKLSRRGEPFDIGLVGWFADWADPANFFEPLLDPELRPTGNTNYSYYVNPRVTAKIAAANRLSGEARRTAWADLDADLMRTDPPWAPILNGTNRIFLSPSFGCFVYNPVYGIDFAAACKK
jgi:ABC-type transport system substrate-binding protein